MLTDEGNDGDAEKSDVVVAINCVTHLQKGQLWNIMLGDGAVLNHHAWKGCLRWRMEVYFNPNTEAENQRIGPVNFPSDNPSPLRYSQGAFYAQDSLGTLLLGIEPCPISH